MILSVGLDPLAEPRDAFEDKNACSRVSVWLRRWFRIAVIVVSHRFIIHNAFVLIVCLAIPLVDIVSWR
jgi:hypothetical protein